MSIPGMELFFAVPQMLWLSFYVTALIFVASRPSDRRGAKKLALIGITLLLVSDLAGFLAPRGVVSYPLLTAWPTLFFGLFSLGRSLLSIAGTSLLLAAIFRKDVMHSDQPRFSTIGQPDDRNPYVPPSN